MASKRKIDVFGAFQPFLDIINICNSTNFRNVDKRIVIQNIFRAIAFAAIVFGFTMILLSDAWYCISVKFDFSVAAVQLGILINSLQFAITYISFRWKIRLTDELIQKLSRIINKRRCKIYRFSLAVVCEFTITFADRIQNIGNIVCDL